MLPAALVNALASLAATQNPCSHPACRAQEWGGSSLVVWVQPLGADVLGFDCHHSVNPSEPQFPHLQSGATKGPALQVVVRMKQLDAQMLRLNAPNKARVHDPLPPLCGQQQGLPAQRDPSVRPGAGPDRCRWTHTLPPPCPALPEAPVGMVRPQGCRAESLLQTLVGKGVLKRKLQQVAGSRF